MSEPTMEPLVTVKQLATHLNVSDRTLHNWRARGMPHYLLPGATLRFRVSEVEEWLRHSEPTAGAVA